jgi:acetyltransferase EpsM
MKKKILLYGASGHGLVIADILGLKREWSFVGFVDDDPAKASEVLGSKKSLPSLMKQGVKWALVSMGDNRVRMKIAVELSRMGFKLATAVHPAATIAGDVELGEGTVIMAEVAINPKSRLGRNVIVNTGATIDHHAQIEDGVHVGPGAHLAGNVRIGAGTLIGVGAAVIQGISIGTHSIVGAGAVVIRDIPDSCTVVGNPARPIKRRA